MSVHTAILCPKCKDIIGTRTSTWEGKTTIKKDQNHKCEEMLFRQQTSAESPICLSKPECSQ